MARLDGYSKERMRVHSAREYYEQIRPLASKVDLWETTFHHVLDGPAMIVEWMKGTGLGPYLSLLNEAERLTYLADYELEVAMAYPPFIPCACPIAFAYASFIS